MKITGNRIEILLLLIVLIIPLTVCTVQSEESKSVNVDKGKEFSYSSQDRRDPFEPVYLTKRKHKTQEALKQGYELEELTFVGIVKAANVRFAVMEDAQGRGLWFKKGDHLNTNLWITDITDDKMVLATALRGDIRTIIVGIPRK